MSTLSTLSRQTTVAIEYSHAIRFQSTKIPPPPLISPPPRYAVGPRSNRISRTVSGTSRGSDDKDKVSQFKTQPDSHPGTKHPPDDGYQTLMGESLQSPAGPLWTDDESIIPQIKLYDGDGRRRKRVLVLCTGGTLTMAPNHEGALAPVQGAISRYLDQMDELNQPNMPEITLHEYDPFVDSSDLGPADWARLAQDIRVNYLHFDGFVILTGTDTMCYAATALSFMLENLGKPVVFTGSQIPLCEPYNDARRNFIMAGTCVKGRYCFLSCF